MRVLLAMSGGVDSSVAAALLLEQGHDVSGVFLRSGVPEPPVPKAGGGRVRAGCCTAADAADAARVADLLGIPFWSLDFERDFERIVADFADAYAEGRTPNPCVACNRDLKFGRLLAFADAIGAEAVATGHYAATESVGGRTALRIPRDRHKDQTYVLFALSQQQLRRTRFPLAALTKDEVRGLAASRRLPVCDKPESMDICFVPGGDYREVVATRRPDAFDEGDLVDEASGEVLGRHRGPGSVTVGQRRGLGVATSRPLYVTRIDAPSRRVYVGGADALDRRAVVAGGWVAGADPTPAPGRPLRGRAKVRRNHDPVPAVAEGTPDGRVLVRFDAAVRAPSPGQSIVLYDEEERVAGGGWIAAVVE